MKPVPQSEVLPDADDGPVLLRFPDPKTTAGPSSPSPAHPVAINFSARWTLAIPPMPITSWMRYGPNDSGATWRTYSA